MTDWKQVEEINRQIQDLAWRSIWTNDLDVIRSVSERIEYLTQKKKELIKVEENEKYYNIAVERLQ